MKGSSIFQEDQRHNYLSFNVVTLITRNMAFRIRYKRKKRRNGKRQLAQKDKLTRLQETVDGSHWKKRPESAMFHARQIAVPKEYNVRRHYDTNHAQVYKKYSGKARDDKVEELEQSLKQQQSLFKNVRHVSDAAVKASYIISNEIAASSRPFTEGDFVKKCMLLTADVICPDKRQAFANVSLSRNTIAERINEIAEDIDNQLQSKVKSFVAFSVAIDESTDVCDVAQLAVFIRELMKICRSFESSQHPDAGKNKLVTDFYDLIRAFEIKLQLFQRQIASHNLAHFPNLKSMQNKNNIDDGDLAEKYCEKISKLRDEFQNRFSDFKCMENEFAVFRNPFSVDVNVLPEPLQLEIIDMQCDSVLKDKFSTCQLSTFYQYVDSKYPNVKYLASKIMSMYGSTFACEQLFSVMNINKSRLRSKLSDEHLNSILKIATKSFTPNFDALVKKKRSQVSGSSSSQH
ncbi:general transcription factor II-I repeat domain-containing protein 2-like [Macrobrachium rosenbergii]|uniref:general transcription factor II-I repeat domain-containing protein 2-like n=1 Tax=Macrobrachium rosenbergii TaxID=79674 RepID=UPI0034D63194